jgi:ABC-type nitrate/sulfonate/bicarbonate transport system substrate-binding protein
VLVEVATEIGALAAAGLKVDEIPAASSPAQFTALMRGELDAAITNPDNVVAYRCVQDNPLRRTDDIRILAALDQGLGLALYSHSGSTAPHHLRGTTLGVDVATSGFAFVAYELLDQLGLRRVDYTTLAMGSTPRRAEALLTGQCGMTLLNAGNEFKAEAAGAGRLASVTALGPYVGAVLAARGKAIEKDGDMLAALIRALLTTATDLVNGEHADVVLNAAMRRLDVGRDDGERYVRTLLDPKEGLIADGFMSRAALGTVLDLRNRHLPGRTRLTLDAVARTGIIDDGLLPAS